MGSGEQYVILLSCFSRMTEKYSCGLLVSSLTQFLLKDCLQFLFSYALNFRSFVDDLLRCSFT